MSQMKEAFDTDFYGFLSKPNISRWLFGGSPDLVSGNCDGLQAIYN